MDLGVMVFVYFAGIATGIGISYIFVLALRSRKQQIDQRINALGEQFHDLDELIHQYDSERHQQYGALAATLNRLNDTTQKLQKTLANENQRGAWGEQIADGILEAAGFLRGTHFDKQQSIVNSGDESKRPDYTFYLPNKLRIHMDAKFPYKNYEHYFSVETLSDDERKRIRTVFRKDVKVKIAETRKYVGVDTLDCAIMFIPNESLFHFLSEDDEIRQDALQSKVIICSPLSLLIVLALIRQTCETFALEKSLGTIRARLIKISDDIFTYASGMDGLNEDLAHIQTKISDLQKKRGEKLKNDALKLGTLIDQYASVADSNTSEG